MTRSSKSPESFEEIVGAAYSDAAIVIRDEISDLRAGRMLARKVTKGTAVAVLADRLSKIAAEQRKATAASRKESAGVDEAAILAHVRTLSPDRRSSLVRKIQQLDERRSVLG